MSDRHPDDDPPRPDVDEEQSGSTGLKNCNEMICEGHPAGTPNYCDESLAVVFSSEGGWNNSRGGNRKCDMEGVGLVSKYNANTIIGQPQDFKTEATIIGWHQEEFSTRNLAPSSSVLVDNEGSNESDSSPSLGSYQPIC